MNNNHQFPVLMYHKVTGNNDADFLTTTQEDLERQFSYIVEEGYTTISIAELCNYHYHQHPLPNKPLLLTFDDGYADNYYNLFPILKKYALKATVFLVSAFVGKQHESDAQFLDVQQIKEMQTCGVEFGLHSFDHRSYKKLSVEESGTDLQQCIDGLKQQGILFELALAYPFGAYPKKNIFKRMRFFRELRKGELKFGFRIGNRINQLPLKNPFLVQRIDVRGDESFEMFKKNLRNGRKKSIF